MLVEQELPVKGKDSTMQGFYFLLSESSKVWTTATYKIIIKYLNEYIKVNESLHLCRHRTPKKE